MPQAASISDSAICLKSVRILPGFDDHRTQAALGLLRRDWVLRPARHRAGAEVWNLRPGLPAYGENGGHPFYCCGDADASGMTAALAPGACGDAGLAHRTAGREPLINRLGWREKLLLHHTASSSGVSLWKD
jgi:hypothetical protein